MIKSKYNLSICSMKYFACYKSNLTEKAIKYMIYIVRRFTFLILFILVVRVNCQL